MLNINISILLTRLHLKIFTCMGYYAQNLLDSCFTLGKHIRMSKEENVRLHFK